MEPISTHPQTITVLDIESIIKITLEYIQLDQRTGQAFFNAFHVVLPELANKLRSTEYDPFYNSSKITEFMLKALDLSENTQEEKEAVYQRFQDLYTLNLSIREKEINELKNKKEKLIDVLQNKKEEEVKEIEEQDYREKPKENENKFVINIHKRNKYKKNRK